MNHSRRKSDASVISLHRLVLASAVISACMSPSAFSQQNQADADDTQDPAAQNESSASSEATELDAITVTSGLRSTLQKSLDLKRETTVIADALVGTEIGDLPDLSIAESLERITGVAGDRFKGGTTELSIRGLGPFLSGNVFNGREIPTGSDGRDVNFGQYPSELISGTVVYKSQQASFIEGGTAGIVELQTLRPLDFNKRRTQVQALAGYSDYESRVVDGQPYSGRLTASYTDAFDFGGGRLGFAIGIQSLRDTAPEDFFTTSSTFQPCNSIEGVGGVSNNCQFIVNAGGQPAGPSPLYFVSNNYVFRAIESEFDRDALIGSVQWEPNENWEITFDTQLSERRDIEDRSSLLLSDGRRDIRPIEISSTGALLAWTGETLLESESNYRTRDEVNASAGLNVKFTGERFTIAGDISHAVAKRDQDERQMRIQSSGRVFYQLDTRGVEIPNFVLTNTSTIPNFDIDNHAIYTAGQRARRARENVEDEINALRLDGSFFTTFEQLGNIDFGIRLAQRERLRDDGINAQATLPANAYFTPAAIAARDTTFPVENLFEGADTNSDGLTWATWDSLALWEALTGSLGSTILTGNTLSPEDTDVRERTGAFYLQANYETQIFGLPAYGNFGLRSVRTQIRSIGSNSDYITVPNATDPTRVTLRATGPVTTNVESNSFWNILPSVNLVLELADDKLFRVAAYSAMSRPDLEAMSAGLTTDTDEVSIADVGSALTASGNPNLKPLESQNLDFSYEWYINEDTAFAATLYSKRLATGFEAEQQTINVNINGTPTNVTIGRQTNSDASSNLYGVEVSFQHVFSSLPAPFDGLGFQAGWNYADSDFKVEDTNTFIPSVPAGTVARPLSLGDYVAPANIPGFSRNTGNLNLFWEKEKASVRVAYKTRSEYYRPFRSTPIRYGLDTSIIDFSAGYKFNDWLQLRFQVLNVTDEPFISTRPVIDSLAETSLAGRRYLLGLRATF